MHFGVLAEYIECRENLDNQKLQFSLSEMLLVFIDRK